MSTVTTVPQHAEASGHPVDLSDIESKRLDTLIEKIRNGDITSVVMQHLEVDGVLRLDPIVDLANEPSSN